ncbi:hypothetical protein HDU79_004497 [Rhizoclosmatium sp. JEL0117]|nr:hypothetical protein HDU79_004497 [Rhizoclosmatium sp. JEL0117]
MSRTNSVGSYTVSEASAVESDLHGSPLDEDAFARLSLSLRRGSMMGAGGRRRSSLGPISEFEEGVTLASLQGTLATVSGFLYKLHASTDASAPASTQWKQRYFVLTEDAVLFLFRTNDPLSRPITCLPLNTVLCVQDPLDASFVIRVTDSLLPINARPRQWSLKCQDQHTAALWVNSITRFIEEKNQRMRRSSDSSAESPTLTPSSPVESKPAAGQFIKLQRTNSVDSRRSAESPEEREARMRLMHEEYLARNANRIAISLDPTRKRMSKSSESAEGAEGEESTTEELVPGSPAPAAGTMLSPVQPPSLVRKGSKSKKYLMSLEMDFTASAPAASWGY